MVADAKVTNATDSLSAKDGTSGVNIPKPSGAADKVSTQDAQLVELQKAIDAAANERHSKLDKTIYGLTTERDTLKGKFDELVGKYEELSNSSFEKKKQEALEAARLDGDPEKLRAVQSHFQTIEDTLSAKAKLDDLNAEIEARKDLLEKFNATGKKNKAKELEEATGVSTELLLKLFDDRGMTEIEEMESLAETLKGYVAKKGEESKLPHPDRLTSVGSGANLGDMTPDEKIRYALSKK